uniref:PSP proline-rich domain-containing protein n=1 Tax=Amphora coffeiformis TaxID=265554 RepID=A0A7S3P7K2_9STRA
MGLSTAERNKRKRERKKREREERKKEEEEESKQAKDEKTNNSADPVAENSNDVEIEYVSEPILSEEVEGLRKFRDLVPLITSTTGNQTHLENETSPSAIKVEEDDDEDDDEVGKATSKRKLREKLRPTVAGLKRKVARPELVEAHDVTAADPEFLIELKSVPGTVPVPRNWGRKRKYLQGKRGFEKPPFKLPDFILKTGIAEVRDSAAADQEKMTIRQKNRARVSGKTGAVDVDYRTLYDAFFKHQTKPTNLTQFGDMYYEGKELEVDTSRRPGELSAKLREALGMASETSPPPWLLSMQRYGPPPSYPSLKIPGLNAPLPSPECQYGYHPGGWGKPPVDPYGRPLYGGNPFDPPGSDANKEDKAELVTSDGKTLAKVEWGALPIGNAEESEEEESSDDDMEDSDEEEEEKETEEQGVESVLPPPFISSNVASGPVSLRKDAGDETPAAPKQLYQVVEQKQASNQGNAVFASDIQYVVPGAAQGARNVPEGAESVLAKSLPAGKSSKRKRKNDDDDDGDDLDKKFKF